MAEVFAQGTSDYDRMAGLFMDAGRELSDIRPEMDAVTAEAMGLAWSQRWARIIPNLRGDSYGNVTPDRMHESVWELYQSWDEPASYDLLLGRIFDGAGNAIAAPSSGTAADIPRLTEDMLDEDELDRLAAQEAAIEMAKASLKPKSNDDLAVELFQAHGRPAKPSEIFPLMVKAGYTLSDRTFRDLCAKLGLQDKLIKRHDGTYAAIQSEVPDAAGRLPGPEDDADGRGDGPDGGTDLRPDEGGAR